MATLGEMLRDAREARGVSLGQAERETKIRQKFITALEDDSFASLPSPIHARGFIRNYAIYLGLDPDNTLEIFDDQSQPTRHKIRAARGQTPPKSKGDAEKISIQPLSPEPIDTRVRFGTSYIAISLLALPLIIVFYFVYSATATRPNSNVAVATRTARPPTVTAFAVPSFVAGGPGSGAYNTPTVYAPQTPGSITTTITPTLGVALELTPTVTVVSRPAADSVTVKVVTTRDAWMRVVVDGVQQYSGTVPRGTTRQWEGEELVGIRTGRADSVRVTVNGSDLGLLGDPDNLIVEKEWNRAGEERVISR